MSLLIIRSTLRNGITVGLALGAGVAVIDTAYAAAGAAGAAGVLQIEPLRLPGGGVAIGPPAVGAGVGRGVVPLLSGVQAPHSAFRIRMGGETGEEVATPRR